MFFFLKSNTNNIIFNQDKPMKNWKLLEKEIHYLVRVQATK